MVYRAKPLATRFWAKVLVINDQTSCWEWQGSRNAMGYGRLGAGKKGESPLYAHRIGYELQNNMPIPSGMQVCHRCDNPPCVRGDHLFIGTQADNLHDMVTKGRHVPNGLPPTCPRGHPYPENARYWGRGRRNVKCAACDRDQQASKRQQKKEDARLQASLETQRQHLADEP